MAGYKSAAGFAIEKFNSAPPTIAAGGERGAAAGRPRRTQRRTATAVIPAKRGFRPLLERLSLRTAAQMRLAAACPPRRS